MKRLSLFIAISFVVAVFSPLTASSAAEKYELLDTSRSKCNTGKSSSASEWGKCLDGVEIPSVKFEMELSIIKGRGYYPSEENKIEDAPFGTIFIDSIFTPIKNVQFTIENYRVEQKTDFEKLILNITTDGSVHPKEALKEAAKILIQHFMLFSDERITLDNEMKTETEEFDESSLHMRQLLKTKLVDMDLSVRALNCLKAAEVDTLGDLVSFAKSDLLKFRNFGKKSLTELEDLVDNKGLTFGMNVAKYKLDKD